MCGCFCEEFRQLFIWISSLSRVMPVNKTHHLELLVFMNRKNIPVLRGLVHLNPVPAEPGYSLPLQTV